jgi:hypothetical protein
MVPGEPHEMRSAVPGTRSARQLAVLFDDDPEDAGVLETLDRVLDKGIVVDAWARVSSADIDLTSVDARVVVVSSWVLT